MKMKFLPLILISTIIFMTGCTVQNSADSDIPQEEQEIRAVAEWFSESMTDEDEFPDVKDYQYYARSLGLEKDAFLNADMWEVFYNDSININREIDGIAYYLIRLNPEKLIEIYARNNNCTTDEICKKLSLTYDQLYYNFGCTASSVDYTKNHKDNKSAYSQLEADIFGRDNGENRQIVLSTHILAVDVEDGNSVTYSEGTEQLTILRRDLLKSTTKLTHNYSEYTEDEKNPAFYVNGVGIRRVLPLSIPNAYREAVDTDITVMLNLSPFSYGCTDEDKITLPVESEVEE